MNQRSIIVVVLLMASVTAFGTYGYVLVENWSVFDSLYMTVITIASVGYGEIHDLSFEGRVFTIVLIFVGSGVMVYTISTVTAFIVEGDLTEVFKRMKMNKKIDELQDHYIVCGESAVGRYAMAELQRTQRPFVVIERDPEKIAELRQKGFLFIEGDATSEKSLMAAGVQRAKGLVSMLHTDADNLFVVLTAKELNPGLRVVAKVLNEDSQHKLRKVGADGVVMPDFIGGMRIVSELVRPGVVNFLDSMLRDKDRTIRVEEIRIEAGSSWIGKNLGASGVMALEGASLIGLVRAGEPFRFNPPVETLLQAEDVLILVGQVEAILQMQGKAAVA